MPDEVALTQALQGLALWTLSSAKDIAISLLFFSLLIWSPLPL